MKKDYSVFLFQLDRNLLPSSYNYIKLKQENGVIFVLFILKIIEKSRLVKNV